MYCWQNLNQIEVVICETSIDLNIIQDEFFLMNDVLKEYDKKKRRYKNFKALISLWKILIYLYNNISVLFEV